MPTAKATLADSIFKNSALQKNQSIVILNSLLEIIKRTLESGGAILITGFGKFTVKKKKPVKEETHKPRNLCNLMPGRWFSSDAPSLKRENQQKERNHRDPGELKRLEPTRGAAVKSAVDS